MNEVNRRLQRFVDAKNRHGFPQYSQRAVRDCLALLVIGEDTLSAEEMSEPLQRLLGQFAMEIGFIGPGATADKLQPLLDAYFERNPPDIALLEEMRAAIKEGQAAAEQGEPRFAYVN